MIITTQTAACQKAGSDLRKNRLKFAAVNLKKYAFHKWIRDGKDRLLVTFFRVFCFRFAF